jgi:uncharacterized protein (DUF305 family)
MKLRISATPYGLLLTIGLGIGVASSASYAAVAANSESPFLVLNRMAMDKMMAGMAIKPAGDADRDFVAMMVPHHQGAIDMAEAELQYGHNQRLLRIAQEIVVQQQQEIVAMRLANGEPANPTWMTSRDQGAQALTTRKAPSGGDARFVTRSNAAMDKMMSDMAARPTGDVDHDFVAMMVPHHQGAIDMAEAELQSGQNLGLKTIAQEIVVEQQQEITLMRLALDEPLPQSAASPTQPSAGAMQAAPTHESDTGQMQMSPGMPIPASKH